MGVPLFCDSLSLCRLVEEIRAAVVAGRVERVVQHGRLTLEIELRRQGERAGLLLSIEPRLARLHLTTAPPSATDPDSAFCSLLHRRLKGARLVDLQQRGLDRVVELEFEGRDELGDPQFSTLVVEVMGKHSNAILLDAERRIIDAFKRVPARLSRHRVVLPRQPYVDPPGPPLELASASVAEIRQALQALASHGAHRTWGDVLRALAPGLGRLLIAEVCHRAGIRREEPTSAAQRHAQRVAESLLSVVTSCTRPESPVIVTDAREDSPPQFAPLPLQSQPAALAWDCGGLSGLVEQCAAEEQQRLHKTRGRSQLLGRARAQLKKLHRRRAALDRELARAAEADLDRRRGQALLVHLHEVTPGTEDLTLPCPETGELLQLRCAPGTTPAQAAERYFTRAGKRRRAAARLPGQIAAVEQEIEKLKRLLDQVEGGHDLDASAVLRSVLDLTAPQPLSVTPKAGRGKAARFNRHVLAGGLEALIGRSARDNAVLLSQVARPHDLWFHARGVPGPHGIIRSPGRGQSIPQEAIRQMARLLATRGAASRDTRVAIDYTPVKHVRKVKGGPPGAVTYATHQTITVKRPSR